MLYLYLETVLVTIVGNKVTPPDPGNILGGRNK